MMKLQPLCTNEQVSVGGSGQLVLFEPKFVLARDFRRLIALAGRRSGEDDQNPRVRAKAAPGGREGHLFAGQVAGGPLARVSVTGGGVGERVAWSCCGGRGGAASAAGRSRGRERDLGRTARESSRAIVVGVVVAGAEPSEQPTPALANVPGPNRRNLLAWGRPPRDETPRQGYSNSPATNGSDRRCSGR